MKREKIEALWRDPRNRRWGGFYHCKEDPRVIVPRRFRWMGWTINTARPAAIPVLLLLLGIVAGPLLLVRSMGMGRATELFAGAASLVVLCLVCARLASRTE